MLCVIRMNARYELILSIEGVDCSFQGRFKRGGHPSTRNSSITKTTESPRNKVVRLQYQGYDLTSVKKMYETKANREELDAI